jgi:hypothetical protein
MATCLVSCYGLFVRIHSCFCESCHNDVYNCLNICLNALLSTIIFNLMHSISFFYRFMFDVFITKGGEYGHKVGWTPANQVVERRNMINDYLRKELALRVLGGVLILSFYLLFSWFYCFSCFLLVLRLFPLSNDRLKLFLAFLIF